MGGGVLAEGGEDQQEPDSLQRGPPESPLDCVFSMLNSRVAG